MTELTITLSVVDTCMGQYLGFMVCLASNLNLAFGWLNHGYILCIELAYTHAMLHCHKTSLCLLAPCLMVLKCVGVWKW